MGGLWGAVATGAVTLAVGFTLLQLELGGRRRRRRRDIREELELLTALGGEHSAVASRIRARLAVKLEQYEPDAVTRRRKRDTRLSTGLLLLLSLGAGVLLDAGAPWWAVILAAVPAGILPALLEARLERRREEREQDEAVARDAPPLK